MVYVVFRIRCVINNNWIININDRDCNSSTTTVLAAFTDPFVQYLLV